eukprot:1137182-Rhodomonas_salina.1
MVSHSGPAISSMVVSNSPPHSPSTPRMLEFGANNLGVFDSSASLRASTSCEETGWVSDSS